MSATPPPEGTARNERLPVKTLRMAQLNRQMLLHVRDRLERDKEWKFFCECGQEDCCEWVFLTLDAYVALHDGGGAVLAQGHRLSQVERAHRLGADAEALRRQADHQVRRARRNLAAQTPVRVLVVDDSEVFRQTMGHIVSATPGFEVVGFAESGREALAVIGALAAELVLLDTQMPEMDGIETARRIRRLYPETVVLLLTANRSRQIYDPTLTIEDKRCLSSQWLTDSWRRHGHRGWSTSAGPVFGMTPERDGG